MRWRVMYLEDGKEKKTAWFYNRDRARKALELMKARHNGKAILYLD